MLRGDAGAECVGRPRIIEESQRAKNCNLSRLLANLSRLNCLLEVNANVFTVSQQVFTLFNNKRYPVLVNPVILSHLPCLVFESVIRF